ncbi:hypothetical protein [Streptomyces cadmiisoli]|uniref:Uncharacterized protein n=1 Tax=Streptomyces cadmiisoli TaxID=2184053 RepID=A0A2Z4IYA5_9ACTN|nr:hypothetical protein [Streptomyces cadmiisoli]AWW37830.1 hypothetical protein DN051_15180 [Streptomyces cadmiisoli]
MTARSRRAFDAAGALSGLDALLTEPLAGAGAATADEGAPDTGEWTATKGAGFVLVPLWEGEALTGVYAQEWSAAEEAAEGHLAALVRELDGRWGAHRAVGMRVPLFRAQAGEPLPEPFQALADHDCFGDLAVWGPVTAAPGAGPRWVAVSLNQSDGDAPMILTALVTDRPITEPAERSA